MKQKQEAGSRKQRNEPRRCVSPPYLGGLLRGVPVVLVVLVAALLGLGWRPSWIGRGPGSVRRMA